MKRIIIALAMALSVSTFAEAKKCTIIEAETPPQVLAKLKKLLGGHLPLNRKYEDISGGCNKPGEYGAFAIAGNNTAGHMVGINTHNKIGLADSAMRALKKCESGKASWASAYPCKLYKTRGPGCWYITEFCTNP
jgi:hypothetical protein